jgi:hypothetical protein
MNGFMAAIHALDRSRGLDLILHTPGGSIAATEALVTYLRSMFNGDIRAVVPQIAMSAGTMIALACREIVMGKHSSLGPIDPQINGSPAHGMLEMFDLAKTEIKQDSTSVPVWQVLLSRYPATFIASCRKAIELSNDLVTGWLESGMMAAEQNPSAMAKVVVEWLGSPKNHKTHDRHVSSDALKARGVKIVDLERMSGQGGDSDQKTQDKILAVHHACIHTLTATPAMKIIENSNGSAFILTAQSGAAVPVFQA